MIWASAVPATVRNRGNRARVSGRTIGKLSLAECSRLILPPIPVRLDTSLAHLAGRLGHGRPVLKVCPSPDMRLSVVEPGECHVRAEDPRSLVDCVEEDYHVRSGNR